MRSNALCVGGLGNGKEQVKALFVWRTNDSQSTLAPAYQPQAVQKHQSLKKPQNVKISALVGHMCVHNNTSAEKRFLSDHGWNWTSVVTSLKYSTTWKILIILICQKCMCCPSSPPNQLSRLGRCLYACKDHPCPAHAELKTPVSPWQGCRAQAEGAWLFVIKTKGKSSLVSSVGHTIHWQGRPMVCAFLGPLLAWAEPRNQNHRITRVGRDPKGSLSPTLKGIVHIGI